MTPHQTKLKVFKELCWHDCDFMSCWIPLPATVIARHLNISVYQCRKAMRQLVEEGMAVRDSCSCNSEDECYPPLNGFLITKKGRDTDIYRYCALKNARICAECFGGKLESFLPENFNYAWIGRETPVREQLFEI